MRLFLSRIEGFFFRPITANGFGAMRIAWAATVLYAFIVQWMDVAEYYGDGGFIPLDMEHVAVRTRWHFTLLHVITSDQGILGLYVFLLATSFLMMIGLWPRLTTILSVILVCSFHERNPFILSGGDTVLRLLGVILIVAPGLSALSVSRLERQYDSWRKMRTLLPPLSMPAWPYRLVLWQMIVLYVTATWYKLLGQMWLAGTAVIASLHHPYFVRVPMWFINFLVPILPAADFAALAFQASWILLLIPSALRRRVPLLRQIPLKRALLIGGVLFHGGILILMDAGDFSLAMFTAYCGLLLDDDFQFMRRLLNRKRKGPVTVLFDGRCGLCRKSLFWLTIADWLDRLKPVDFRDPIARAEAAPDITEADLDKSMHIRHADGRTLKGFDAFRSLCAHLPPYWPLLPILWFPGVAIVGRKVYAWIAGRRDTCSHGACAL